MTSIISARAIWKTSYFGRPPQLQLVKYYYSVLNAKQMSASPGIVFSSVYEVTSDHSSLKVFGQHPNRCAQAVVNAAQKIASKITSSHKRTLTHQRFHFYYKVYRQYIYLCVSESSFPSVYATHIWTMLRHSISEPGQGILDQFSRKNGLFWRLTL